MPFPAIPTRVVCPRCREPFNAMVRSIVDVGEEPDLKEQFLAGEVNLARCPKCGSGGMMNAPLIYHDPEKELLVSYVPAELGLPNAEQERLVGSLVNAVMNSVPADQRKGYFLHPKAAFTLDGLYDTVLEADGITKEVLEAQRAQLDLINKLMEAMADEQALDKLVEENRSALTYNFFLVLSDLADSQAQVSGREERARSFLALRDKLLEKVNPVLPQPAAADATFDDLLTMLQSTEPGAAWTETIALNANRLDYAFFQTLTARIEAAESGGDARAAADLTALRQRILEEMDAQRRRVREVEDEATLLILDLCDADDLPAALREHKRELNQMFFAVLARLLDRASARNDTRRADKLSALAEAAQDALEEDLPPDVRLIGQLMRAEYPDGSDALLDAHRGLLTNDLLKILDRYVQRFEQDAANAELADRLKEIRGQIVAKMTILRA